MKILKVSTLKISKNDSLTSLVKKNAFYSLALKILSVLLSFWSIRVAFDFTGSQQLYGLWLTIISVVSWLSLLNGGLGNGLRNKLSQALATNKLERARAYVSTSYTFIILLSLGLIILYLLLTFWIDWRFLFNAGYMQEVEFAVLFSVVVVSYFIQLALTTINAVCFAFNRSTLPALFTFISNLLFVISLYVLKYFGVEGLLVLGLMYSISMLIVLLIANIALFRKEYTSVRPSIKYFEKDLVGELIGNGIKFFLLEISAVIIFATDSMIITHVVGSEEVAIYQLVMKLFSVFTIISGAIMVPLWSAFTHAYSKGDIVWIKKVMRKIMSFIIPLIVGIILMSFMINPLLDFWMGDSFYASPFIIFAIATYVFVNIWSNIFAYFLNGINKVNGQLLTVGIGAIVNIPLSIFLSKNLGLGTVGIVLGTILSLIPFSILGPINTFTIIKSKFVKFN